MNDYKFYIYKGDIDKFNEIMNSENRKYNKWTLTRSGNLIVNVKRVSDELLLVFKLSLSKDSFPEKFSP